MTLPRCPFCHDTSTAWMELKGYSFFQCRSCQHVFIAVPEPCQHVESVYGDDYFFGGGAGYENYLDEAELLRKRGIQYAEICKHHLGRSGKVLDIGAAAGFLIQGWCDAGWHALGIEPNPRMCQHGIDHGLDLRCGTLETVPVEEESVDCVAMVQVISHLIDPARDLDLALEWLKPGGILLIETWDRTSWIARLFGKGWHEYSPPSVLHWFTRASLRHLLEAKGLKVVQQRTKIRWINVGHVKSLLHHVAKTSWIARIMLGVFRFMPSSWNIPYVGDDLFYTVASKPLKRSEKAD